MNTFTLLHDIDLTQLCNFRIPYEKSAFRPGYLERHLEEIGLGHNHNNNHDNGNGGMEGERILKDYQEGSSSNQICDCSFSGNYKVCYDYERVYIPRTKGQFRLHDSSMS